jgi:rhodanese-related sulfurtransferase
MATSTGYLMVFLAILGSTGLAVGVGAMALSRFKKANISMDAVEFFTRLLRGRGFTEIGPEALSNRIEARGPGALLVDLREPGNFEEGHIEGAMHRPFDDFLREVVAEGQFQEYREKDVVLICDTGHMSRVVGEILALDLGFTDVFSLKGGMKRWWKWEAARTARRLPVYRRAVPLPRCCARAA